MSDISGSNSSLAKGNRGSGLPIPFYNFLLTLNVGEFGQHRQTFATVATKVFEQGYDLRHGLTMAIPVVLNELIIRISWVVKQRFYHQKDWKECVPSASVPELRRMLLVGHGALCLVDGVDAYFRSGGEIVTFLTRTNMIAWVRFGHLSLKEISALIKSGKIDHERIDEYLDSEFKLRFQNVITN